MDWFERLTGFRETDYDDTRAKLVVEGSRLRSLINGKSYGIGELELVPLQALRERAKSGERTARAAQGKRGDRRRAANASVARERRRAVPSRIPVQLAGDGLAHGDAGARRHPLPTRPHSRPGVRDRRRRGHDLPQLLRAGRRQPWPDDGRQFDGLADLGEALSGALNQPVKALWRMQNGYALCTRAGLDAIAEHLGALQSGTARYPARQTAHRNTPRRGSHRCRRGASAAGLAGLLLGSPGGVQPVCHLPTGNRSPSLVLQAAYEATMWAAVLNAQRGASNVVLLTQLGGGAFGNDEDWIHAAMRRALEMMSEFDLDVKLVSYGTPPPALLHMAEEF